MKREFVYLIAIISVLAIVSLVFLFGSNFDSNYLVESRISNSDQSEESEKESNSPQKGASERPDVNSGALLPDLWVQKLASAYIVAGADGSRALRFPGTFANTGDGPLELEGNPNEDGETIRATQIIYQKDGSKEERLAGDFIFHPTHRHWHFEDFVSFSLLETENDNQPGRELVSTGKITYCIHDYGSLPDDYPGKPGSIVYPWCAASFETQGISVGWVDTYTADVPGQELDITNLPDGTYAFRAVADPENRLIEKDESNNTTITFIEIEQNSVRILDNHPYDPQQP